MKYYMVIYVLRENNLLLFDKKGNVKTMQIVCVCFLKTTVHKHAII